MELVFGFFVDDFRVWFCYLLVVDAKEKGNLWRYPSGSPRSYQIKKFSFLFVVILFL